MKKKTKKVHKNLFDVLLPALPNILEMHAPGTAMHFALKLAAREEALREFSNPSRRLHSFGPFGKIVFPFFSMGVVDSTNLFDLDELIVFAFYWQNRKRYKRVLDIGANIGLHSIIMNRCGFQVRAYEPDPVHFEQMSKNMALNKISEVWLAKAAVSDRFGVMEFVRVLGNTTSSHVAGSKNNPYGNLERYPVRTHSISDIWGWADLVKMDVEGHEWTLIKETKRSWWTSTDAIVEVGTMENAEKIFHHLKRIRVRMYSQKLNWGRVTRVEDLPKSYRDGLLFVSMKDRMPW